MRSFLFNDKPAMLTSADGMGFALMPDPAFIPLLPKHVHALIGGARADCSELFDVFGFLEFERQRRPGVVQMPGAVAKPVDASQE